MIKFFAIAFYRNFEVLLDKVCNTEFGDKLTEISIFQAGAFEFIKIHEMCNFYRIVSCFDGISIQGRNLR